MKKREELVAEVLVADGVVGQTRADIIAVQILKKLAEHEALLNLPKLRFSNGTSLSHKDGQPMFEFSVSGACIRGRQGDPLLDGMTAHILDCHETLQQLLKTMEEEAPHTLNNGECDRAEDLIGVGRR
ncbi:hypothetical protein VPH49_21870 [Pseudomonas luteola]|uniref:hypothetical protein n=1 Tax=Pseudomonas luteola TaxID=47886 RepID=UPI003A8639A3